MGLLIENYLPEIKPDLSLEEKGATAFRNTLSVSHRKFADKNRVCELGGSTKTDMILTLMLAVLERTEGGYGLFSLPRRNRSSYIDHFELINGGIIHGRA